LMTCLWWHALLQVAVPQAAQKAADSSLSRIGVPVGIRRLTARTCDFGQVCFHNRAHRPLLLGPILDDFVHVRVIPWYYHVYTQWSGTCLSAYSSGCSTDLYCNHGRILEGELLRMSGKDLGRWSSPPLKILLKEGEAQKEGSFQCTV
jgi:hypothetical protein